MIREIYEGLSELLSTDPNYLHQRAKCYIRSAYKTRKKELQYKWLERAYRDATNSYKAFETRYDNSPNDKILISSAHALYTAALSLCHLVELSDYSDIDLNVRAVGYLYKALTSPFNSLDFVKKDSAYYNYNNAVERFITKLASDKTLLENEDAEEKITELLVLTINSNAK